MSEKQVTAKVARTYRISATQDHLIDLKARLHQTRWPETFHDGWNYGADYSALRIIHNHWLNVFDWRALEERLNAIPQFMQEVDGIDIHYFRVKSVDPDALPLLLIHGWPGSPIEYIGMIERLTAPGSDALPFELIIPSLPGFGFSGKPTLPGWGQDRIVDALSGLMAGIGHERFGVHGGDWGTILGRRMAQRHPDRVLALHINMPFAYPPEGALPPERWARVMAEETAYLGIHNTKPDAIALGQSDSPMGLTSWILEKFASWSDGGKQLVATWDLDILIANLMFYWLPNSAASAARIYFEANKDSVKPFFGERVTVPTGVAAFAHEPYLSPREWIESSYNLVRWRDFAAGGHFAALEQPDVLASDIRSFFKQTCNRAP